jgi:hypothetical protein
MFTTQLLEVQSPACLGETITSNQVEVIGLPPTPTLEEAVSDPLDPVLGTEDQLHRTHGTEDLRVASQIQILGTEDQLHRTHGTEEDLWVHAQILGTEDQLHRTHGTEEDLWVHAQILGMEEAVALGSAEDQRASVELHAQTVK